jgi:hypothetical protein
MVQLSVTQAVTVPWNFGSEQIHVAFVGAQRPSVNAPLIHFAWTLESANPSQGNQVLINA